MQLSKWLPCAVLLGALMWLPTVPRAASIPVQPASKQPTDKPSPIMIAGRASCSGVACHGNVEAEPGSTSAHAVWLRHDAHARAYETLFNERSRRIARNLNDGKDAHENERCLACHVTPGLEGNHAVRAFEGVGCESCHGPAKGKTPWLHEHTSRSWVADGKPGMNDLTKPAVQARVCAGCHVGAAAKDGALLRDVDHDLIAAGHPRLAFEFVSYHANLPPHWKLPATSTADSATAWALGRLMSADAALELLEQRVSNDRAPWPEFAEHDCFACHADLRAESRRGQRAAPRIVGTFLPANVWNMTGLEALNVPRGKINDLLETLSTRLPARLKVDEKAKALRAAIAVSCKSPPPRRQVLVGLVAGVNPATLTWDEAMQLTLAAAALAQPKEPSHELARQLQRQLAYPLRHDSPADFRRDGKVENALGRLLISVSK